MCVCMCVGVWGHTSASLLRQKGSWIVKRVRTPRQSILGFPHDDDDDDDDDMCEREEKARKGGGGE